MIFPLAEGNLVQLWQDEKAILSLKNPLWLLRQCHGLTQGLHKIHQYEEGNNSSSSWKSGVLLGRHGDIKPQNILWFRDSGTSPAEDRLVLSDFTLMRFHAIGSNEETTMRRIAITSTYCAPEVEVTSGKHVSQKYDVWSLGCVFLEFISCHLLGYDATLGLYFRGHDDRDHKSFHQCRLDEHSSPGSPENKYFNYKPGMQEAKVKETVRQVSQETQFSYVVAFGRR